MNLIPVFTEKSLSDAKRGFYTFWVDKLMTKNQIRKQIEEMFKVHVTSVKTINYKGGKKRTLKGIKQQIKARKKTYVTLKDKEKIDLFEEKGKGK